MTNENNKKNVMIYYAIVSVYIDTVALDIVTRFINDIYTKLTKTDCTAINNIKKLYSNI